MTSTFVARQSPLPDGNLRERWDSEKFRQLTVFQKSGILCDIEIRVGREDAIDERTFFCHRNLLAAASAYFERMFVGAMKESEAKVIRIERIEGVQLQSDADAFQLIIDYIYSSPQFQVTRDNVHDLICCANFFQVRRCHQMCVYKREESVSTCAGTRGQMDSILGSAYRSRMTEILC